MYKNCKPKDSFWGKHDEYIVSLDTKKYEQELIHSWNGKIYIKKH